MHENEIDKLNDLIKEKEEEFTNYEDKITNQTFARK